MKNLYLIFLCCLLSNCTTSTHRDVLKNVETLALHGAYVKNDTSFLFGDTDMLTMINDNVYIYNPIGEYGFIVYNIVYESYTNLGRRGGGPKDGILYSPYLTEVDSSIVCFDISKRMFLYYKSDSLDYAYRVVNLEQNEIKGLALEAFPLNDSISLVTGAYTDGICAFLKNGKLQNVCLEPYTEKGDFVSRAIKDANIFKLSNNKKHLLRITQNGGLIALYSIDIARRNLICEFKKEYFGVECELRGTDLEFTNDAKYGYIDACMSDKYIYGLYSGKTIANANFEGKEVHVYNFKGELLKRMLIDISVSGIAVKNDDKYIYGLTTNGEKEMCYFILP
ncbi:BF3164 family lipoprotein [Phocaeicola sp.]